MPEISDRDGGRQASSYDQQAGGDKGGAEGAATGVGGHEIAEAEQRRFRQYHILDLEADPEQHSGQKRPGQAVPSPAQGAEQQVGGPGDHGVVEHLGVGGQATVAGHAYDVEQRGDEAYARTARVARAEQVEYHRRDRHGRGRREPGAEHGIRDKELHHGEQCGKAGRMLVPDRVIGQVAAQPLLRHHEVNTLVPVPVDRGEEQCERTRDERRADDDEHNER